MRRILLSLALVVGCSTDDAPPEPAAGCNPLVGDDCITPFPSSFYEAADPTSATGVRVSIDDGVLPAPRHAPPLTAARLNRHDGVSPASPFVAYFAAGVDPTQLPTQDTLAMSVTAASTVQVIDFATGVRVPVFAELDANAFEGQRQSLIIRPMTRLAPSTRYVIALVGLNDTSGKPLAPAPFVALRDKTKLSKALTALAPAYEDIFAMLDGAGVPRASLTLAWDVTTASDADATGHLVSMRDTALAMVPQLTWTITKTTDTPSDPDRLREIIGTFSGPSFMKDDSMSAVMNEDATGNPVFRALGTANFVVEIPQCATTATAPLPVMVYGHGLFGTAPDELGSSYMKQLGNKLCMIEIGTDWLGLANYDFTTIANDVLTNFNNFHILSDRLQQAHVNAQTLTRLVSTRMISDPALAVNGQPVTDGKTVYYYGISNGGIQGGTYMALSEDVTRGVLDVPGCEWTLMMFRSADFEPLQTILGSTLPDPMDQEVLLAMIQPEMDFSDPASFAPHLLGNPLPSVTPKHILVQESFDDSEVSNVATRVLARTIGLPGMDLEHPVFGITEMPAPLASAYTQWDVTPTPPPPAGNTPSDMDNGAHGAIRKLVLLEDQVQAFFTPTGMVTQTCTGPCVCDINANTCVFPPGVE